MRNMLSNEEYAYNVVMNYLPEVMGQAYLAKYDCSKMKQDVEEICREIID